MKSYDPAYEEQRNELEEIIVLAESSAASIDTLIDTRNQTALKMSACGFIAASAVVGAIILSQSKEPRFGANADIVNLIALLLGLAIALLVIAGYLQYMKFKKNVQELLLERSIHGNLISLLDEQLRRMENGRTLSIVALTTINIRIKRLDRAVGSSRR